MRMSRHVLTAAPIAFAHCARSDPLHRTALPQRSSSSRENREWLGDLNAAIQQTRENQTVSDFRRIRGLMLCDPEAQDCDNQDSDGQKDHQEPTF
jgi:hypothetical protein